MTENIYLPGEGVLLRGFAPEEAETDAALLERLRTALRDVKNCLRTQAGSTLQCRPMLRNMETGSCRAESSEHMDVDYYETTLQGTLLPLQAADVSLLLDAETTVLSWVGRAGMDSWLLVTMEGMRSVDGLMLQTAPRRHAKCPFVLRGTSDMPVRTRWLQEAPEGGSAYGGMDDTPAAGV